MGAFINDTTPESVAERLRAVIVPESAPSPAAEAPAASFRTAAPAVPLASLAEGAHA
jgi:hypothetical protein